MREAGAVWIGASTPGMAIAGEAKLGFLPDDSLQPGPLGLMSKSGTLSYESGYRLAQRGVGTSVWIGVGGDPVKGTRYADLVPFYASDAQTEALLIIGEIGGHEEEEFARGADRAALRQAGVRADRRAAARPKASPWATPARWSTAATAPTPPSAPRSRPPA